MITVWAETKVLNAHSKEVYDLAWLSEGFLVTGSHDFSVVLWDVTKGRLHQRFDGP